MLFQYGQLVLGINTTTASGGTVTLTNVSKQIQALSTSGSNGETYVLPDATTMTAGQYFEFFNNAAGSMIINNNGGTTLYTVNPGSSIVVTLVSNGTSNGTWSTLSSGSGIGSGSKNYLTAYTASTSSNVPNSGNGNFESGSTSGWSLAHSSLTSNFPSTVGSGGNAFSSAGGVHGGSAANANLSLSVVSSNQLAGSYSASYSSSTATTAGDMIISNAFFIDIEDQAKIMQFSIAYKAQTNPSNGNFSGTSSNSFAVAIYDVTNNAWIMPAGVYNLVQNSGVGLATGTFQTTSNSTQYQIALYNANASSGAITLYLDDFFLGPQIVQKGPAMSDWQSYTPTFTGFGTVSGVNAQWRRVGDSVELNVTWTNGTVSGTQAQVTFPSGLVSDSGYPTLETVGYGTNTSSNNGLVPLAQASVGYLVFGAPNSATAGLVAQTGSAGWNTGATNSYFARVKIAGWSSNSVQSSDTDTRVVAAEASGAPSGATTANTPIIFPTVNFDTHAGYNATTGRYTVTVSGYYQVATFLGTNNSQQAISVYQNGSLITGIAQTQQTTSSAAGIGIVKCSAGDLLDLRPAATLTVSSGYMTINRLSGPAVITASETVAAAYTSSTTTSTASTDVTIVNPTKVLDTHNAYNSSTGTYTVPVSGIYEVICSAGFGGNVGTSSTQFTMKIKQNATSVYSTVSSNFTGNARFLCLTQGLLQCNAGDAIIFTINNNQNSFALDGTNSSYFTISRRP